MNSKTLCYNMLFTLLFDMNREIKFRGKRKDNLDWFYGSLIVCDNGETEIVWAQEPSIRVTKDVYPDTIGQYTGLQDKNGKDIYEGDIVRWTRYNVNAEGIHNVTWVDDCTIYWNDEKHAFWKHYDFETGGGASGMLDFKDERAEYIEYEVIGNIYDNPELLKGGKE